LELVTCEDVFSFWRLLSQPFRQQLLVSGADRALCGSMSLRLKAMDVIGITNDYSAGVTAIQN
jgi:hypothetical protein